jgi:hypothetical protein
MAAAGEVARRQGDKAGAGKARRAAWRVCVVCCVRMNASSRRAARQHGVLRCAPLRLFFARRGSTARRSFEEKESVGLLGGFCGELCFFFVAK